MEIGQKIYWIANEQLCQGLFLQNTEDGLVEVICYHMGVKTCRLRVYIDPKQIEIHNGK